MGGLAAGNQLGTLNFGEVLPAQDFEEQEYSLILTPVNDPATVLFESAPLTPEMSRKRPEPRFSDTRSRSNPLNENPSLKIAFM